MNVAVINLKEIFKYLIKIITAIFIIFIFTNLFSNSNEKLKQTFINRIDNKFIIMCLDIPNYNISEDYTESKISLTKLINEEFAMLNVNANVNTIQIKQEETIIEEILPSPSVEISRIAQTEEITEKNFTSHSTNCYGTTCIDNQSDYEITEEILKPDIEITNKNDIIIYHTHTSESYTPCEIYNYTMTGNYRTTDSNYNIVRVGEELKTYLSNNGFNVIHDKTYHDYPAYSGSYSRSLETAERLIAETSADIVIDLHRDAIGNGDTYGPTVMVNGEKVAQLMFVIGTDGGGLEHPNWVQNLKTAIKIQEKANEMYPGLFRSIIIRNSRYNQHVAKCASIIEVGATANKLGECLLSMQCLANVIDEVCI